MKRNKRGVSLIVLVITIIVMVILASAVIISLNNTNIIDQANEAVDSNNLSQVSHLASLIWAEAYLDGVQNIDEAYIKTQLTNKNVDVSKYLFDVTENGVEVLEAKLKSFVKSGADYGKTINYVSDNGVTGWRVLYHTSEYVYLIASEKVEDGKLPNSLNGQPAAMFTSSYVNGKNYAQIYWADYTGTTISYVGDTTTADKWMANWNDGQYTTGNAAIAASYLLDESHWTAFKNSTASYSSYVGGAIGTPTAEMFVASWNASRAAAIAKGDTTTYNKKLALKSSGATGYYLNNITDYDPAQVDEIYQTISMVDNLYIWSSLQGTNIWLIGPSASNGEYMMSVNPAGYIGYDGMTATYNGVRPVVCLSVNTPAQKGTTTDIAI